MKLFNPYLTGALSLVLLTAASQAAALVTFNIDSGGRSLRDALNSPLTAGNPGTNGDGAVVQIGYFQTATTANNFGNGVFVALTGEGSLFGVNTTIGDTASNLPANGEIFTDPLNLFAGQNGGVNDGLFPTAGTPLSLRIFNGTTIAGSSFFMALSNDLWLWNTPAEAPSQPVINIFLDSAGLISQNPANVGVGTPGTNIQTLTPTPEPGTIGLLALGLTALASRRRRAA
jgi:hypothetical protein